MAPGKDKVMALFQKILQHKSKNYYRDDGGWTGVMAFTLTMDHDSQISEMERKIKREIDREEDIQHVENNSAVTRFGVNPLIKV